MKSITIDVPDPRHPDEWITVFHEVEPSMECIGQAISHCDDGEFITDDGHLTIRAINFTGTPNVEN